MIIEYDGYRLEYNDSLHRVEIIGNLRLRSLDKYDTLIEFLMEKTSLSEDELTLDLTGLELLNSSGIASLGLYLVKAKETGKKIKILASRNIHWQSLSMEDFQNINDNVAVEYVVHH